MPSCAKPLLHEEYLGRFKSIKVGCGASLTHVCLVGSVGRVGRHTHNITPWKHLSILSSVIRCSRRRHAQYERCLRQGDVSTPLRDEAGQRRDAVRVGGERVSPILYGA